MLFGDKVKVLNKPSLFQNFAASALSALSLFGSREKKFSHFSMLQKELTQSGSCKNLPLVNCL